MYSTSGLIMYEKYVLLIRLITSQYSIYHVAVVAQPADWGTWNEDSQKHDRHGKVFVYTRSGDGTWTDEPQVLVASDYADGDYFGDGVDISGDRILVGASEMDVFPLLEDGSCCDYSDVSSPQRGKAYIFFNNAGNWEQEGEPLHPDEDAIDPRFHFGAYVALDGDTALIGHDATIYWDDFSNLIVYGFTRGSDNNWEQSIKLTPSSLDTDNSLYAHQFGRGVQLHGNRALIEADGSMAVLFENWEYVKSESAFSYLDGFWVSQRSNRLALDANSIFLASTLYNPTENESQGRINVIDNFSLLSVSSFACGQSMNQHVISSHFVIALAGSSRNHSPSQLYLAHSTRSFTKHSFFHRIWARVCI